MNNLNKLSISNFLKGTFIGFANVIPGISGGTIAVITGIYDEAISSFNTLFSKSDNKKNAVLFIIPIIFGVFFGLFLFSNLIEFFLNNYEEQTFLFFMGLIFGTVPFLHKISNKQEKLKPWHYLVMLVIILGFCSMSFWNVSKANSSEEILSLNYKTVPIFFLMGFISISAMIIPGISGSFIMLVLGFYSNFVHFIKTVNIPIILIFLFGGVFAFLFTVKVLNYILKRHYTVFHAMILGLVIGSNFFIFPQISSGLTGFLSILFFTLGYFLSSVLCDKENVFKLSIGSIVFILLSLLFGISVFIFSKSGLKSDNFFRQNFEEGQMAILAHRGGSNEAPENTLYAFDNASNISKDIILEMDVHLSLDKVLIVYHDDSIKRTTGIENSIEKMTYQEIQNTPITFRLDSYKQDYNQTVLMPRLEEVLQKYNNPLLVEIKTYTEEAIDITIAMLKKYNRIETTLVSIEDHETNLLLRKKYPQVITSASRNEVKKFFVMNIFGIASFYNPPFDVLAIPDKEDNLQVMNRNFINAANKKNLVTFIYTINDKENLKKYINYGISGIITDEPSLLYDIVKEKNEKLESKKE